MGFRKATGAWLLVGSDPGPVGGVLDEVRVSVRVRWRRLWLES